MRSRQSPTEGRGRSARASQPVLVALAGVVALGAVLALGQPRSAAPNPTSGPTTTDTVATPPPTQSPYDADGVPRALGGEPVLRGSAIATRVAAGDPAPFLVAGWHTQDPTPSCAPSTTHCGYTSLVDAPGGTDVGVITLDWPGGTQFSFDWSREWAGGFYVLRVRAACAFWSSTCLAVDEEVEPMGTLPVEPDGFGADGLPLTVDGQPVTRGTQVAAVLRQGWDTQPVYVAGQAVPAPTSDQSCPDLVTWETHPCPAVRLDATGPTLTAVRWGLQDAWGAGATWPGGLVVLRAMEQSVLGFVPPPGAVPTQTAAPMPSLDFSNWGYNKRVIEIAGQPVGWGPQITDRLAAETSGAFLVTGAAEQRPCPACAGGTTTVLVEPPVAGAKPSATAFPLLRSDGTSFQLGAPMVWSQPKGVVVLEVRRYVGSCAAVAGCGDALEVLRVAAPPSP